MVRSADLAGPSVAHPVAPKGDGRLLAIRVLERTFEP